MIEVHVLQKIEAAAEYQKVETDYFNTISDIIFDREDTFYRRFPWDHFHKIGEASVLSRRMRRLEEESNLIIGGKTTNYKIGTVHPFNPRKHIVRLREGEEEPRPNDPIQAIHSEVAIEHNGKKVTIYDAIFERQIPPEGTVLPQDSFLLLTEKEVQKLEEESLSK